MSYLVSDTKLSHVEIYAGFMRHLTLGHRKDLSRWRRSHTSDTQQHNFKSLQQSSIRGGKIATSRPTITAADFSGEFQVCGCGPPGAGKGGSSPECCPGYVPPPPPKECPCPNSHFMSPNCCSIKRYISLCISLLLINFSKYGPASRQLQSRRGSYIVAFCHMHWSMSEWKWKKVSFSKYYYVSQCLETSLNLESEKLVIHEIKSVWRHEKFYYLELDVLNVSSLFAKVILRNFAVQSTQSASLLKAFTYEINPVKIPQARI